MHTMNDSLGETSLGEFVAGPTGTFAPPSGVKTRDQVFARVSRGAADCEDRHALLRDAASLVAESLDTEFCAYAMADVGSEGFELCLCPLGGDESQPAREEFRPLVDMDARTSLAVHAIERGETIVAVDLPKDGRFRDGFLLSRKIHCGIACPLKIRGRVVGLLGAFSREPLKFSPADAAFVETIGSLLSQTLARLEAERALAAEKELRLAMLENVGSLVLELSVAGEILLANGASHRLTGFAPQELQGRAFANALVIPEECAAMRACFLGITSGNDVELAGHILTKEGTRRRIDWRFAKLAAPDGPRILATGTDVTAQEELKLELARSEAAVQMARQELDQFRSDASQGKLPGVDGRTQPFGMLREGQFTDRRRRPRRLYPYVQRVAPIIEGTVPTWQDFHEVRCRDIAAGGFSFLLPHAPVHREFVVAFGVAPSLTYLVAKAVHTTTLEIDGHLMHVVGCEYTGRIEL